MIIHGTLEQDLTENRVERADDIGENLGSTSVGSRGELEKATGHMRTQSGALVNDATMHGFTSNLGYVDNDFDRIHV